MLIKTRGIIFKTIKYSETSVIVDVFTEERGLRKYIISGVRTKKAKVSASLLQVMSLVELVAYEREGKDLHRIREIRPAYVYTSLPFEVRKGAIGLFIAEIARKTIRESEENKSLFMFLFNIFKYLDQTAGSIAMLHLHFLLELSAFLGFLPGGEYDSQHPYFDMQEGVFVTKIPSHFHYFDEKLSHKLQLLLQSDWQSLAQLKISRAERKALLHKLLVFYRLHIENLPAIHSHLVLEEVLG